MDTTRRRTIVFAALTTLLLAACGGTVATNGPGGPGATGAGTATQAPGGGTATQAPGGPASVAAPCTLLTAADIEQATGFKPTRQAPTTDPGELPVGCEWELDNPGATPWGIVIGVRSPGGLNLYEGHFTPPLDGEPIEGVGDAAVQTEPAVVEAIKGDTYVSVTYFEFPERAEVTVELARLIMAKV